MGAVSEGASTGGIVAAWLNGRLVDPAQPQLLLSERGLTVGEGVFETLVSTGDEPFAVTRHLERLRHSAGVVGIPVPAGDSELRDALRAVIAEARPSGAATTLRLRLTVLGGPGAAGTTTVATEPTVAMTATPLPPWPPHETVVRSPWPRNERAPTAGAKTTAYADNIVVARWAVAQGAGEAVLPNLAGNLCEATAANVFVEHDGVLVTPTLASGCLGGVTRALLLELGVAVERDVPFGVLDHTSGAFLSSTTRHVHPIASIDGVALPACPGPLTQAAAAAFEHLFTTTPDP
jgi:branched-chain amino acid aminotransferase